jgi:hypothetical protein
VTTIYHPGLLQVRPQYSEEPDAPDHIENVTWWQTSGSGAYTISQIQSFQAAFDGVWGVMWNKIGATDMHYYGSIVTDWSSDTGLSSNSVGTYSGTTGSQGTNVPPQVAVLISGQVGLRFKGGHPRVYLPYVGQDALTDEYSDSIEPSVVAALTTAYQDMGSTLAGLSAPLTAVQCLYRRKTGATLQWTAFTVQGLLATQRRRVRKPSRKR